MSPMWQAGMAPTAAPSQLRLTLLCHDRLDGLPFTAHEFGGGGGDWTHQTLAALCLGSPVILLAMAHNIQPSDHVCLVSRANTLFSEMAVALCCVR